MEEYQVHRMSAELETRNKLKSLQQFTKIPTAVTITIHGSRGTRSVTLKEARDTNIFIRAIEDRIHEIEDAAVDFGVKFADKF